MSVCSKDLACVPMLDYYVVVSKQSKIQVTNLNDLLGGGHSYNVSIIGASMEVINHSFNFLMGKKVAQNGVDSLLIHNISNEEVMGILVVDVLVIISREMR